MNTKLTAVSFLAGVALAGALIVPAEAKSMRMPVSSMGSGSDSDKSSAREAARQSAEAQLVCVGRLEDIRTNSTGCSQIGEEFLCMAVSTATCILGE